MFAKWVTVSAAAILGCSLAFSPSAFGLSKELTGIDGNGNTIDSGWSWTVSDTLAPLVNLVFIKTSGSQFFFEKDATFQNTTTPVTITFAKTNSNAKSLVISDEVLVNKSGSSWNQFSMSLNSTSSGNTHGFAFATSDNSSGLGDFKISPFTSFAFTQNNSVLTLSGGTVADNTTFFPGSGSTTGLAIVANGSSSNFDLVEQPNIGGGTPPPVVPLPAAAWTGLSGLIGLGLLKSFKNIGRVLR